MFGLSEGIIENKTILMCARGTFPSSVKSKTTNFFFLPGYVYSLYAVCSL